jgi:hypothetical protein
LVPVEFQKTSTSKVSFTFAAHFDSQRCHPFPIVKL